MVVLACGLLVGPATGQVVQPAQPVQPGVKIQPVPIGGLGGPNMMMINDKGVQADLKITEEQAAKIRDIGEKQTEALKEIRSTKEGFKKYQEMAAKLRDDLNGILTRDQAKRLKQLELQARGPTALFDPQVTKDLGMTNEQRLKVSQTVQQQLQKMSQIIKDANGNFEAINKGMRELNQSALEEAVKTLSREQQGKWRELVGEPFKGVLPGQFGGTTIRPQPLPGGGIRIQPIQPIQPQPPVQIQPPAKRQER
jgi:Spy/CpxP family protein refolding chaperone